MVPRPAPAAPVQMSPAPRVMTPSGPRAADSRARTPVPLQAPLPRLDSILVDGDRRLAVLDGQIVGIGGRAGDRTVVRIESDAVVLREPSGLEVRVAIGGAHDDLPSY